MKVSAFALYAAVPVAIAYNSSALPVVDLDYELHQALSFNSSGGYYNFSNIRYAQPPIGDLRFRAPLPPVRTNSSTINDGSLGRICPQANPAWIALAQEFLPAYLTGKQFNVSAAVAALSAKSTGLPAIDPRTTEDCLFLDVAVPKTIFDERNSTSGAPVLVWIYGGGYTAGEKSGFGVYNPAGLLKASQVSGSEGLIYVALNYRLGAFGWLAGPTLQSDGTANAGLYDQRLALQWIQENIHLFGGDPNRVTVIGESAGGGSIMHQITAFGGLMGPSPFQQAIPQSPGWALNQSNFEQESTLNGFLSYLNVSTIQQARTLPPSALILANILQVGGSTYGGFTYGPVVDGSFVPALPGKLLLQGSYDKSLKIMVGHNADEGLLFSNPAVTTNDAYSQFLISSFPDISPAVASYIENVLYPPIFNGSYGYIDDIGRTALTTSEGLFTCNTNYLDRAYGNKTYSYQFSIPPALHGQDIPYTFFNGPNPSVLNSTVALALQEYITSFAQAGAPSAPALPVFPQYGANSNLLDLGLTQISVIKDNTANARCLWWQKGLVF